MYLKPRTILQSLHFTNVCCKFLFILKSIYLSNYLNKYLTDNMKILDIARRTYTDDWKFDPCIS